jgi:hypothetical protein
MKKILIILLTLFIFGFSGCAELKGAKVLMPYSWTGMKKISPQLYVEKTMDKKDQEKIQEAIPKAKEYVADTYGETTTTPVIYACKSQQCKNRFGLEGTVIAVRLLGHLILTEKGLNKEVISHEWSHEELYERIGGFYHWYREIPLWFDEGLASLTMHEHSRYDERAWNRILAEKLSYPQKDELVTLSQWTKANHKYLVNDTIAVPYATARHMVSKWYRCVGKSGLDELLRGIKEGKRFETLYRNVCNKNSKAQDMPKKGS